MNFDWQTIAVALILALTGVYVGRRVWQRLRGLSLTARNDSAGCATGCGKCEPASAPAAPKPLIAIGRSKSSAE